jgi:heat shock protein HtpX
MVRARVSNPHSRALGAAAAFAVPPAVVAGLVAGLLVAWYAGLAAFVLVGAAVFWWALRGGDRVVLAGLAVAPPDPRAHARLLNLVDGLCTAAGAPPPRLLVVASPALNAMAAGSGPGRSVVAVTEGLLGELDRVELEAVLAEAVWLVRHREAEPATVVAATFGAGRRRAIPPERDSVADLGAVSLTRYPPGLASALEKIDRKGSLVAGVAGRAAGVWLAHPTPTPGARLSLTDRAEALREL